MAGDSTDNAPTPESEAQDSSGEFFTVGTPLHAIRAGYIRRKADDLLYGTVVSGRYAHVLAPARTGKSSLVAATTARLENNGFKVAVLDLAQISMRDGGSDPGRWYYNVAYRLLRQLRIRYDLQSWWQDKAFLGNRQRLVEFYSEIILQTVPERIVVFIDDIQCTEELPYAEPLLASIRAAHNARTTDPDFSRLVFVLLGECDPTAVIGDPEVSPFSISQQVTLEDFTRQDLDLFATELDLDAKDAAAALDRIYYWTRGQPYLSQKMARAVARDRTSGDVVEFVDSIAMRQLAGRAALHSEPHMNHIHRAIVGDTRRNEPLLNLYGKIRKGVEVSADLGCPHQRRLIALGLLEIDEDGGLRVRNRLYESVFTARWANENLPINLRVPAAIFAGLLLVALVPFWYTQWLPRPYLDVLTSPNVELDAAASAYENLRSFPGHAGTADVFLRLFLESRALAAVERDDINAVVSLARELPDAGRFPESLEAGFHDRRASAAMREERRDDALLATLRSLVQSTSQRRQRAAMLVADDYPQLLASLPGSGGERMVFDPTGMVVTTADGARISQWSYASQALSRRNDWSITALEVSPLVRRVVVDREGRVSRIGLTVTISHTRTADLRIKLIAPSGRAVEIETGVERATSDQELRIAAEQLSDLVGESLAGTWSLSVRDESPGIAGQFVGWNLKLNSQSNTEDLQRGLDIPEPVERETDSIWFDGGGRYAVARAMQSDSARIWDLAFAEPVRAIAVNQNEALIGLDAGARHLVTATQDSVNLWDTASGGRVASIATGPASGTAVLTADGKHLFVERRGDVETSLELWSLEQRAKSTSVVVAGTPSLLAVDATGKRVAAADYDRAVRIWDFATGELQAQIDLPAQPSAIRLSGGGEMLGVLLATGFSLWRTDEPAHPLHEEFGPGNWQLAFSPSGSSVLAGNEETGFQIYAGNDARAVGPPVGFQHGAALRPVLAYSNDEKVLLTGDRDGTLRFWKATPVAPGTGSVTPTEHRVWSPSGDRPVAALPGGETIAIGDPAGHVHILPAKLTVADLDGIGDDVSFVGHNARVRSLSVAADGSVVASAADDNSVRIWDTSTGQPLPTSVAMAGSPIVDMAFSPDASLLGLLNADRVQLVDVSGGEVVAAFELGEPHSAIAFAGDSNLFLGAVSGALRQLEKQADDAWRLRQIWQGGAAIRLLEASPRGEYLVVVDAEDRASQFVLAEGRMSESTLELPGRVREATFSSGGGRVMFRTARWVHRASASARGLVWADAVLVPRALPGARLVTGRSDDGRLLVDRVLLPTVSNAVIELTDVGFGKRPRPKLFGNKDELLAEWELRLKGRPAVAEP